MQKSDVRFAPVGAHGHRGVRFAPVGVFRALAFGVLRFTLRLVHGHCGVLLFIILCLAVMWSGGCSAPKLTDALVTDQENIQRIRAMNLLDHTVALAPIKSEITKQKIADEETECLMEVDTKTLTTKLVETFRTNNVFKKMEKISPKDNSQKSLIKEARAKNATLLMRMTLKKARVYCTGNNDSALGNTAMWFMLGIPSLWGADMNYGVEIVAEVSFLDVVSSQDFATLLHSYEYTFKEEGGMNYLERSGSLAVLAIPPQFCPDDLNKVKDTILPLAQEQFLLRLAEQTKKELGNK